MNQEYENETMKVLYERSSCRTFTEEKVPGDLLNRIIEAGIHGATGGNLQPYSIIKIEDEEAKKKLAELNEGQDYIAQAPVNLLFCIDWHRIQRWAEMECAPFTANKSFRHFWISFQDTIICAQNICTAADSMGLGSVYSGTVLECFRELKEMLNIPEGVLPVVLLSLGYPKARPAAAKKLGVDVIVHNEKYNELPDDVLKRAFDNKYPTIKLKVTDDRMDQIKKVCTATMGGEFASKCLSRINENGYINAVQRYFGLHYTADEMPVGNEDYLKVMEEYGFSWFKKYQPFDK